MRAGDEVEDEHGGGGKGCDDEGREGMGVMEWSYAAREAEVPMAVRERARSSPLVVVVMRSMLNGGE